MILGRIQAIAACRAASPRRCPRRRESNDRRGQVTNGGQGRCPAISGRLEERYEVRGPLLGEVDFNRTRPDVHLSCVPDAKVGDFVIVHIGFAISVVDAAEAQRALRLLDALGELDADGVPGEDDGAASSAGVP